MQGSSGATPNALVKNPAARICKPDDCFRCAVSNCHSWRLRLQDQHVVLTCAPIAIDARCALVSAVCCVPCCLLRLCFAATSFTKALFALALTKQCCFQPSLSTTHVAVSFAFAYVFHHVFTKVCEISILSRYFSGNLFPSFTHVFRTEKFPSW